MRLRFVSFLLLWCAGNVLAQQTSGSIEGRIVDPQGAVVGGAKISLTDQKQGSNRSATTGSGGSFTFNPLPASDYTLTVEAPGFNKVEQKDITLYAATKLALQGHRAHCRLHQSNHQRRSVGCAVTDHKFRALGRCDRESGG